MAEEPRSIEITQLLNQLKAGDGLAIDRLYARVYQELRRMARAQMRGERAGHTLQATDLIHEAYLRLVEDHQRNWANRGHFYAVAARVMRRILVDYARSRNAQKRGGDSPDGFPPPPDRTSDSPETTIAIDQLLDRLAAGHPRPARIVELSYFGGFTEVEVAELLDISDRTVKRDLRFARAWLKTAYSDGFQQRTA